jgi:hypothetical protein
MSCGIGISQWVIDYIAISIQALWVGIAWYDRVRTQEAVNIRRIGLPFADKITRRSKSRAPPIRHQQVFRVEPDLQHRVFLSREYSIVGTLTAKANCISHLFQNKRLGIEYNAAFPALCHIINNYDHQITY